MKLTEYEKTKLLDFLPIGSKVIDAEIINETISDAFGKKINRKRIKTVFKYKDEINSTNLSTRSLLSRSRLL